MVDLKRFPLGWSEGSEAHPSNPSVTAERTTDVMTRVWREVRSASRPATRPASANRNVKATPGWEDK
eukprot:7187641-Pyramimonas_sp.AAC.1